MGDGKLMDKEKDKILLEIKVMLYEYKKYSSDQDAFSPAEADAVSPRKPPNVERAKKLPERAGLNAITKELAKPDLKFGDIEAFGKMPGSEVMVQFKKDKHMYVLPGSAFTKLWPTGKCTLFPKSNDISPDGMRIKKRPRRDISTGDITGFPARRLADLSPEPCFPTIWLGVVLICLLFTGYFARRFLRQRKSQQQMTMRTRRNLSVSPKWPLN